MKINEKQLRKIIRNAINEAMEEKRLAKIISESIEEMVNNYQYNRVAPNNLVVNKFKQEFEQYVQQQKMKAPQNFNELYNEAKWYWRTKYTMYDPDAMLEMWADSYGGTRQALNAITQLCQKAQPAQRPAAQPAAQPAPARQPVQQQAAPQQPSARPAAQPAAQPTQPKRYSPPTEAEIRQFGLGLNSNGKMYSYGSH